MLLVLTISNKIGFVDDIILDKILHEYKFWSRCNDLIISWIIFNLDATIREICLIWKNVVDMHL